MMTTDMIVRRFTVGSYPINGYLVADTDSRLGAFIDPGGFHDEIADFIDRHRIELRHILLTHGHWDHTDGIDEFTRRYRPRCYAGSDELSTANHVLGHGEQIELGQLCFTALSTPGHTPGGISYYCADCVFTGDAIFCGSVGGTASARAADCQIDHVRQNIFSLPDRTLIFPAHGPVTTVAAEKYANPFFSPDS